MPQLAANADCALLMARMNMMAEASFPDMYARSMLDTAMAEIMPTNPTTHSNSISVKPRSSEAHVRTWGITLRRADQLHFHALDPGNIQAMWHARSPHTCRSIHDLTMM